MERGLQQQTREDVAAMAKREIEKSHPGFFKRIFRRKAI
jgi:hypothetical protein